MFGTGGDEINLACFANDTSVQSALKAKGQTIIEAIGDFIGQTHEVLTKKGRTPVIWEDTVVGDEAVPMQPETIVTAWRGNDTFANITEAGFRVIQASYEFAYMDWCALHHVDILRLNCLTKFLTAVWEDGLAQEIQ